MENKSTADLHNQDDVNPTTQLDKIVIDEDADNQPKTEGTGGNRPVQTDGSVIVKED